MARYLADTSALIHAARRRDPARSRIQGLLEAGEEIGICAIGVAEYYAGLKPGDLPPAFVDALTYYLTTRDIARRAGAFREMCARRGRAITTTDALIAAVAAEYALILLTANVRDFELLPIRIEDLRPASPPPAR